MWKPQILQILVMFATIQFKIFYFCFLSQNNGGVAKREALGEMISKAP